MILQGQPACPETKQWTYHQMGTRFRDFSKTVWQRIASQTQFTSNLQNFLCFHPPRDFASPWKNIWKHSSRQLKETFLLQMKMWTTQQLIKWMELRISSPSFKVLSICYLILACDIYKMFINVLCCAGS